MLRILSYQNYYLYKTFLSGDVYSSSKGNVTMKIDRLIGRLSILLQKDKITSQDKAAEFYKFSEKDAEKI